MINALMMSRAYRKLDSKSFDYKISDLNASSSSLTSPNRPPLVAVCDNIVRGGHRSNGSGGGAGGSMSSSATSSPGAQVEDKREPTFV